MYGLPSNTTVHNLRPSIIKFAAAHMYFKIKDLAAVLAYIEAKQTQGKKISRHDA